MKLNPCPHCGGLAELTFKLPVYGWGGCKIKCLSCGGEMQNARFAEQRFDEETRTLHTPVTLDSVVKCIELTVEKWNRRADNG